MSYYGKYCIGIRLLLLLEEAQEIVDLFGVILDGARGELPALTMEGKLIPNSAQQHKKHAPFRGQTSLKRSVLFLFYGEFTSFVKR